MTVGSEENVATGQRYRDVHPGVFGPPTMEWTVEAIYVATDGIKYARLCCVADLTQRKTLSLSVLADRRRFMRV